MGWINVPGKIGGIFISHDGINLPTGKVPPLKDLQKSIDENLKIPINIESRVIPETILSNYPDS